MRTIEDASSSLPPGLSLINFHQAGGSFRSSASRDASLPRACVPGRSVFTELLQLPNQVLARPGGQDGN